MPVNEFARLAGLQSRWNAETGDLRLDGAARKPVTLAAGSASATVEGAASVALQTPVLKEGNAPVMVLQDLLPLVQGRITSRKGDTLQVRV